jgi:hypothetical protein
MTRENVMFKKFNVRAFSKDGKVTSIDVNTESALQAGKIAKRLISEQFDDEIVSWAIIEVKQQ